jgi:3-oxoacyl-[acyl-carrier-protein] synthase-3
MAGIVSLGWFVPAELQPVERVAADHGVSARTLRDFGLLSAAAPGPDDHPSTLAARASELAIGAAGIPVEAVDLVIFAGLTRDQPPPWVASFAVLHLLGHTRATGFDLSARCPGIHDALWVAANLVRAGAFRTVLVCCGDRFDYLLPHARKKIQIAEAAYSAGGAAAIVSDSADNEIVAYAHLTNDDLSLHGEMGPTAGGSRRPLDAAALAEGRHQWQNTLGVEQALRLREFLGRADRHNIQAVCRAAGFEEIDFVAVSPLSVRDQMDSLAGLGIGPDKVLPTLPTLGHMGPADSLASVGLAIAEGKPVGPRLVMSTRSITSSNALAVRGRAADLGIRVAGAGVERLPRG